MNRFFFKKANFYFRDPNSAVYILDRVILARVWYISKVDSTQRYTNTHLLHSKIKMMSVNQISVYHTLLEAYNVMRHLSSEQIHMKWKLIEREYALRSTTKKKLNVPEKPKLKCLGFTYNGAKLFNMLPIEMKKVEDPNTFKTLTKEWIWKNIPSY